MTPSELHQLKTMSVLNGYAMASALQDEPYMEYWEGEMEKLGLTPTINNAITVLSDYDRERRIKICMSARDLAIRLNDKDWIRLWTMRIAAINKESHG